MTKKTLGLNEAWARSSVADLQSAQKRPAPFSIRLTQMQRRNLQREAKGQPLGNYVRSVLFNSDGSLRPRKNGSTIDATTLARMLGLLGKSELHKSLRDLATAASDGALPVSPELCEQLSEACHDITHIRTTLLKALGSRKQP
ncbi:MAG: hypothetical protein AAF530_24590 [Pseudomonadota bacterium]